MNNDNCQLKFMLVLMLFKFYQLFFLDINVKDI